MVTPTCGGDWGFSVMALLLNIENNEHDIAIILCERNNRQLQYCSSQVCSGCWRTYSTLNFVLVVRAILIYFKLNLTMAF